MSELIKTLELERDAVRKRIGPDLDYLENLERVIKEAKARYELAPSIPADTPERKSAAPGSLTALTVDAALAAIELAGRPLRLQEVLDAVRAKGIEVGGKRPEATLSARLFNSDRITSDRSRGYWFADRPWPGEIHPIQEGGDARGTAVVTKLPGI